MPEVQAHSLYVQNETIDEGKLNAHAQKHLSRVASANSINTRVHSLTSQFNEGDMAANKAHATSWRASWDRLQADCKKHMSNGAYLAGLPELNVNQVAIDTLNSTIKEHGYFEGAARKQIKMCASPEARAAKDFFDLDKINHAVQANPIGIYTQVFGTPKKASASEMRYSGGLIVALNGPKKGLWYDFNEEQGGGICQAIMRANGVDYKQSIVLAAQITGVESTAKEGIFLTKFTPKSNGESVVEREKARQLNIKSARSIWAGCIAIKGPLAETYLKKHRGIADTKSLKVKFWPVGSRWLNVGKDGKTTRSINKTPALVVSATDINGHITAVQRVYLDAKTGGKNHYFDQPKLTKGPTKGSFCYLQKGIKGADLYIAEGVETAASIAQIHPRAHIIVSLGQGNMRHCASLIKQINPQKTFIAADNDGHESSSKSVRDTVKNLSSAGINVSVLMPKLLPGADKTDWNDVLKTNGRIGLEREFHAVQLGDTTAKSAFNNAPSMLIRSPKINPIQVEDKPTPLAEMPIKARYLEDKEMEM